VTLALEALVVAGGIFIGRLAARALKRKDPRHQDVDAKASPPTDAKASPRTDAKASPQTDAKASPRTDAEASAATATPPTNEQARDGDWADDGRTELLEGFACKLGDVVIRRIEGDEAWLAGALVLAEDSPVAALFVAPVAGGERALLVPGPPRTALTWLTPLTPGELALSGEPPRSIEHAGARFERTRRLPVHVSRLGKGAPDVGPSALFAEYETHGAERLVVVVGRDAALAWRGVALAEGEYDILPGSPATLERFP
jgi:hypothetical protein